MSINILLAEDEAKLATLLEQTLSNELYHVDVVHDGKRAIDLALSSTYDLVILDLMLPIYTGTEVLQAIRSADMHMPVLILTARDSEADKVENFQMGADDYLTKPFSFVELLMRVRALLKRAPVHRDNILRVADMEIDRLTHQVRRGGKRINLSAKEYALLEYLALNSGKVVSRDMIIKKVWDQSFENVTNIVDVYIRQLRQKIDDEHDKKVIRTVRGLGYALNTT